MLVKVALLLLVCLAGINAQIETKDCGSKAKLTNLKIEGCSKTPCVFKKGTTAHIEGTVESTTTATALTLTCKALKFGIPIPLTVAEPNACKIGISCPTKPGDVGSFRTSIPVSQSYPATKATVRCDIKDQSNVQVLCVEVAVDIQN